MTTPTSRRIPGTNPATPATDKDAADSPRGGGVLRGQGLHPRLLLAALLVSILMLPVGLALAGLGRLVLEVAGGAADDTSLVVAVAGFLVADFWGGGIVATLTRARAPQVAIAWGLARLLVLLLVVLVADSMAKVVPIQLVLAVPAAFAGARASRKQAALRRQVQAESRTPPADVAP